MGMVSPAAGRRGFTNLAGWGVILAGLVIAQGLTALALILVARRVAPAEYGAYLACYSLASLLIVLPAFGMDGWFLARRVPDLRQIGALWWDALRTRVGLLLLWLLLMAALALVLPPASFPPVLLLLAASGLAAESLALLTYTAWRRQSNHRQVSGFQVAAALVLFLVSLALPLAPGRISWFAAARALTAVGLALAVTGWMLRTRERPSATLLLQELLRQARPFLWAEVAVAVYLRADLTIISLFLGTSGAAVYGPALNLINMSFLVPNALYFLVVPLLVQSHGCPARPSYMRLAMVQAGIQVLTGLLMSVGFYLLAGPLVGLVYGAQYAATVPVFRLLSPIPAIKSLNFGLGAILTSSGQQRRRTQMQVAVALISVVLNLLVVQYEGVRGVALVYVVGEVLLCLGYGVALYRAHQAAAAAGAEP